ncbi:hypothetical protein [Planctomicrobium sp. SH527]|uniref:hypothetical protein n=1 Tax=Planctomicrobium sp. SH527 TaxID=3448123 RepID=UPI003F5B6212
MINLVDEFRDDVQGKEAFVVLPVSRLELETRFRIGRFLLFPAGTINVAELNIAKGPEIDDFEIDTNIALMHGESLRQICSSMAAPPCEGLFAENAMIAFQPESMCYKKTRTDHQDDVALLASLSQEAERALDHIRFHFCRFDLPETLPGVVGTWADSGAFCCGVLFDGNSGTSELIAGEAVLHSVVSKGLGLELQAGQCMDIESLPVPTDGEVGGIVQHALYLYSDAMNANTNTAKYLRLMTLIEFLATPFSYQQFKQSKKDIAAHLAGSPIQYESLLEEFKQYSDLKDAVTGEQKGLRTLLVHHGQFLEDILPNKRERAMLFLKLQGYLSKVIADLMKCKTQSWSEIIEFRKQRRAALLNAEIE